MPPEELRVIMRGLGYFTHTELGEAIGVSRCAVSLWLNGKVGVPRPVAMLLRMMLTQQRRQYSDGSMFVGFKKEGSGFPHSLPQSSKQAA